MYLEISGVSACICDAAFSPSNLAICDRHMLNMGKLEVTFDAAIQLPQLSTQHWPSVTNLGQLVGMSWQGQQLPVLLSWLGQPILKHKHMQPLVEGTSRR